MILGEERKEDRVQELCKYTLHMILDFCLKEMDGKDGGQFLAREFNGYIYSHNSGPLSEELIML